MAEVFIFFPFQRRNLFLPCNGKLYKGEDRPSFWIHLFLLSHVVPCRIRSQVFWARALASVIIVSHIHHLAMQLGCEPRLPSQLTNSSFSDSKHLGATPGCCVSRKNIKKNEVYPPHTHRGGEMKGLVILILLYLLSHTHVVIAQESLDPCKNIASTGHPQREVSVGFMPA